jgi:hypothetical protein
MPEFPSVGRRLENLKKQALTYFGVFCGLAGIGIAGGDEALFVLGGIGASFLAPAIYCWNRTCQPPTREIMQLAKARHGLLTISEITSELDIDPHLARRGLEQLQKLKIASIRWQEVQKNLWEFPDYLTLPIPETIELAKARGGRVTVQDLLASGQSLQTANDTLNALSEAGLAHQDPAAAGRAVIVTTQ